MNFQKIINSSIFTIWIITCLVYAANTITSITQTAVNGDIVSATWVNDVNTKLKQDCGGGSVLQWFDVSGNKICATIASNTPTWAIMAFNLSTCPSGWIAADGTSGTPDLRGEFIRGLDSGRWVDSGRSLWWWQQQDWKSFSVSTVCANCSSGYSHYDVYMWKSTSSYVWNLFTWYWSNPSAQVGTKWDLSEVRPRNVAFLYCIKQ